MQRPLSRRPSAPGPPPRWAVTPLPDLAAVAEWLGLTATELAWFADRRGLERVAAAEPLRHYRYRWRTAAGRLPRLVEAPKPRLRAAQRRILRSVLDPVPASDVAHGFVRGRDVRSAAAPHVGAHVVLHLDLETFFAAIPAARVAGLFRLLGYRAPVAEVLTNLCTNVAPPAVRRAMPAGGSRLGDARWRLGRRLAGPHLPQGAPTSPAIANLLCWRLDRRLAGLAASYEAGFTRYADDLVFSGGHALRAGRRFAELAQDIVRDEGFTPAATKTRATTASERQTVCGLVVNDRLSVPRDEVDRLRAILHNAGRTSLAEQNEAGHPRFREHLAGRISWIAAAHPERGARLAALLAAVPD